MALSDKLIPNQILGDRSFRDNYTKAKEKSDAFIRLFGVDPSYDGPTTYDEHGHANTPFYVGEELTQEEIFAKLVDNEIVSKGILGRIKTALLLRTAFPDRSYTGYEFVRKQNTQGNVKYRLEWQDFIGPWL